MNQLHQLRNHGFEVRATGSSSLDLLRLVSDSTSVQVFEMLADPVVIQLPALVLNQGFESVPIGNYVPCEVVEHDVFIDKTLLDHDPGLFEKSNQHPRRVAPI
jgi:hypothetical protein